MLYTIVVGQLMLIEYRSTFSRHAIPALSLPEPSRELNKIIYLSWATSRLVPSEVRYLHDGCQINSMHANSIRGNLTFRPCLQLNMYLKL